MYCIGNPVKYFNSDGNTPWAAVAEGIGTFVLDAGVDFLSNWILEGQDYKSAFKNVAWGVALLDGTTSVATSAFLEAALSTLLENKLNKQVDKLLSYVSSTNTILAQKLKKLERSVQNNKNKTRVARGRHKVDIARTNAYKAELKYAWSRNSSRVKTKII